MFFLCHQKHHFYAIFSFTKKNNGFKKRTYFSTSFKKLSQFMKPYHEKLSQFLKPNHEIGCKEIRTLDSFIYMGFQVMQVESCHFRLGSILYGYVLTKTGMQKKTGINC